MQSVSVYVAAAHRHYNHDGPVEECPKCGHNIYGSLDKRPRLAPQLRIVQIERRLNEKGVLRGSFFD